MIPDHGAGAGAVDGESDDDARAGNQPPSSQEAEAEGEEGEDEGDDEEEDGEVEVFLFSHLGAPRACMPKYVQICLYGQNQALWAHIWAEYGPKMAEIWISVTEF
jgi:hypothetical protein